MLLNLLNIPTFFCGMAVAYFALMAVFLLRHAPKTRFNRVLGGVFAWWAVVNAKDIFIWLPTVDRMRMEDIVSVIDGWSALSYACLVFELTMPGWTTPRRVGLCALPLVALSLVFVVFPTRLVSDIYVCVIMLMGLAIIVVGYRRAKVYTRYAMENYSNIDNIDIRWMTRLCLLVFPLQLLWAAMAIARIPAMDSFYYMASIVLWQLVANHCRGLQQVELPPPAPEPPADEARAYPFAAELKRAMDEDKLYLNPMLTLDDLAARVRTNRTYISFYFRDVERMTFYDYVNSRRVLRAGAPMIDEHPEYTLEHIARQSGFNSLSTFRRAFKKFTGIYPKEYRAQREERQTKSPTRAEGPARD